METTKQRTEGREATSNLARQPLHKEGCPAERVESFSRSIPPKNGGQPEQVTVTRCIDCGNQVEKFEKRGN